MTTTKTQYAAGTLGELLQRKGHCCRSNVKVCLMAWDVEVNGIPSYEPDRILYRGDTVRIGADSYVA